jgi:hypothetical protein
MLISIFSCSSLNLDTFTEKLTNCSGVLKYTAEEIGVAFFFKSYRVKTINELVVTSNKLTPKFAGPGYKWSLAGCGPRAACCFNRTTLDIDNLIIKPGLLI